MSRSIAYTSNHCWPVTSPPVWRSKFIVATIALGFLAQQRKGQLHRIIANDFQHKGEVRFGRTLTCQSGVAFWTAMVDPGIQHPAPSIWAIPEDDRRDAVRLHKSWQLLEMTPRLSLTNAWLTKTRPLSG
jgi:cell division protein FtsI (penicillin-binding protein 3)